MKVIRTRRKSWVISQAGGIEPKDHHYSPRSKILAVCETKMEAVALRDQKFVGAYIDSAPLYINQFSFRK